MGNKKYLFSLDKGLNWSDTNAGASSSTIYLGYIDDYNPGVYYTLDDIVIYRRFDLNGKVVIGANNPLPPPPTPTPIPMPPGPTPTPTPVPTPTPTPTPTPGPVTQAPVLFTVDVVNSSTVVNDNDLIKWCSAVKKQADTDIAKYWSYTVNMNFIPKGGKPAAGNAVMGIFDNSDQAGVLGWHDVGPNNEPLIKIFAKTSESFQLSPSGTISHEIVESISDMNSNTTIKGFDESGKACLYFMESADAVENDLYQIGGVDVSDFVTPAWFHKNSNGPYDFLGHVSKPFQILSGGYMEISYDNGANWNEVNKNSKHLSSHKTESSRWALYKKPIEQRIKSTFEVENNYERHTLNSIVITGVNFGSRYLL